MKSALLHVLVPFCVCVVLANTGLFNSVLVDISYDHYAEKTVDYLPCYLAMPFNSLVNLGYIFMGIYWLLQRTKGKRDTRADYVKDMFALMAIAYAPVQWVRLATLLRAPAVLDQWFTLPIFAWVLVWCDFIEHGWRPRYALTVELCSILSYGLSLVHDQGFEVALGCHVAFAVIKGVGVNRNHGDCHSRRYLGLAVLSCSGFVLLKLLDHTLARYRPFQHLTGHFWSKVCDVLQFHYSFCFLTRFTSIAPKRTE
ncbi:transmembrane protein 187 [Salvelinus fontinalis]|uniref:transmembrane protein 187 n=1 Tax=Salvelinus fontinalis TaxID=8038 RepID=UPI00248629D2|nr:transmembrane protein 187 [Salvelinus fontinalis]